MKKVSLDGPLLPHAVFLLFTCALLVTRLAGQPNVLFITVDDMRPELPAYGDTHIIAPNFDRLSNQGVTFSRAYVQQAICQASRASIMTGARPDTTQIYSVFGGGFPTFRDTMGSVKTLPGLFKDNGYRVEAYGKNFHHVDPQSWHSDTTFYATADLYQDPTNRAIAGNVNQRPPVESYDGASDSDYMDGKVADAVVAAIASNADSGTPFFIGAGFWKPHLPFTAPKAYWDLYDRNTIPISRGANSLPVENLPNAALHDPFSGELGTYRGGRPGFTGQTSATQAAIQAGTFDTNTQSGDDYGIITVDGTHVYPEDYNRLLTHGYYACVSFIDAQLGKILDALEDPNGDGNTADSIADDTIIVLWGDHGFHLGDHGSWPKHTNMEVAARVPFIIYQPGMTGDVTTDALVEMVDVYPTLVEMAGLSGPTSHTLEGISLVPLLDDLNQEWKPAVFNQYPREVPAGSGNWYMGYGMRTDRYRYVQWREMVSSDGNAISLANRNFTITATVSYEELYDHLADSNENVNLSDDPANEALLLSLGEVVTDAISSDYANVQNVGSDSAEAPEILTASMSGETDVGDTLTAFYIYNDANGDAESGTTIEWVADDDFYGTYSEVLGTGATYTLQAADSGRFVKVRVTPQNSVAPTTGTPVASDVAVVPDTGIHDGSGGPAPTSAIYEGFDYSVGVMSSTSAGGRGWSGGWFGNSGLSFAANSGAEVAAKNWNTPSGYHLNVSNTAATEVSNANTPHRQLSSSSEFDLDADATYFFSYLVNHDGNDGNLEFRLLDGTTQTFKVQLQNDGTLDLQANGGTFVNAVDTLSTGTDYLILGKLVTRASGNDEFHVSTYPSGGVVPSSEPVFTGSVAHPYTGKVDRFLFGFNAGSGSGSYWDELNIDSNYLAVVGTDTGGGSGGELLAYEGFDYSAGTYASGNAGGSGWNGGWYGNSLLTWGGNSGSAAVSHTWSNLPSGYGFTPAGVAATNSSSSANTSFRELSSAASIDAGSDSTTYFSFLYQFDGTNGKFEFGLFDDSATPVEHFRIQIQNTGVVDLISSDGNNMGVATLSANTAYVVAGKVATSAAGTDTLSVSFYAAGDTIPSTEPSFSASVTKNTSATIDRVKMGVPFNGSTNGTPFWDELRLATDWANVTDDGSGSGGGGGGPGGVSGTLTVSEDFDYTAGGIASGNAGGTGWNGGWYGNADLTFGGNSGSEATAYTWSSLPTGYGYTPNGNVGANGANGNAPFRELESSARINAGADSTQYFSFLYRQDGTNGKFELGFYEGTTEHLRLQIRNDGRVDLISADGNNIGAATVSSDTEYVIVGKLTTTAAGNDTLSVSLYASGEVVPYTEPIYSGSVTKNASGTIDRIKMGVPFTASPTGTPYFDEFRMGTSYGIVLGDSSGGGDPGGGDSGGLPDPILNLSFANGDLTDSSPSNRTVAGTASFSSAEGRDYATLNGTSDSLNVSLVQSFPNGLSITFWTRAHDGVDGMPKNTTLGWARQNGGDGVMIAPGYNNGLKQNFRVGNDGGFDEVNSGSELANYLNVWVHWAIVKDPIAGTLTVYRDGQMFASGSGMTVVPEFESHWSTGNGYRIGEFWGGVYYKGDLDEYRIYDEALDASEISQIYNEVLNGIPVASNVAISGVLETGETLTASYDYSHGSLAEGSSLYQWYRSTSAGGPYTEINGEESLTYDIATGDDASWLRFGVTPVASDGAEGSEVLSEELLVLNPGSRVDGPIRVMALGDSITYGLSFGEADGNTAFPCGYRGPLQDLLQNRAAFADNFDFIGNSQTQNSATEHNPSLLTTNKLRYDGEHEGYPSYTAARSYGTSPGNLVDVLNNNYTAATFYPDVVLLHIGINDLIAQGGSAADLQTDYRTLLTRIFELQPSADVYVSTLMMNKTNHGNYAEILAFNTYLVNTEIPYWQGQGRAVYLADMFAALEGAGYDSSSPQSNVNYGTVDAPDDTVHPNHTGYANMAGEWNRVLVLPSEAGETAPVASNVSIAGTLEYQQLLTASYSYDDAESDPEGATVIEWLSSDTELGSYSVVASGANYTLGVADVGQWFKLRVTPVATLEPTTGASVESVAYGPITAQAAFDGLPYGLLAYWPYDDGQSPTIDASGNGNDATLSVGTSSDQPGQFGNAIQVTGAGGAQATTNHLISDDFTFAAWVKHDGAYTTATNEIIFSKGWDFYLGVDTSAADGKLRIQIKHSGGSVFNAHLGDAKTLLAPDVWTHVAVARSGDNFTFYINGVEAAVQFAGGATTNSIDSNANPFTVGHNPLATDTWWRGCIDEAQLYERALSSSEVGNIYSRSADVMAAWSAGVFATLPGGTSHPDAALSANPDGDPYNNLLEFAFRLNPLVADDDGSHVQETTVNSDGDDYFAVQYTRRRGSGSGSAEAGYSIDGITYTVERSLTLAPDSWDTGSDILLHSATVDNLDGTETITVRSRTVVGTEAKEFLRLEVSEN